MSFSRKVKTLATAAVAGGTAAYFLDSQNGRRRRDRFARTVEARRSDLGHVVSSARRVSDAVTPTPDTDDDATTSASDDSSDGGVILATAVTDGRIAADPETIAPEDDSPSAGAITASATT